MNENNALIKKTANFVKEELKQAEGGHDWWHIYRVWNNAKKIMAQEEDFDPVVVELGALLHDIADSKFYDGNEDVDPEKARAFLKSLDVPDDILDHIEQIIRNISYKGGNVEQNFRSKELDIIQDADRLDAMGAIGIARAFNYGGHKGRLLYNPAVKPNLKMTKEEYKQSSAPTINHFYEKLLLLKDRMNTETGKKLAAERHQFMEEYLKQFYSEWEL